MNAERIGYLTAKLLQSWSMGMVPLMDEDIDDLLSILDDYEKAKAESSLYLERSIEMGFKVKDLMAELEKAKAEREELQEQYAQLESSCYDNGFPTGGSVFSELEKAEADLEKVKAECEEAKKALIDSCNDEMAELRAEVERLKKLICSGDNEQARLFLHQAGVMAELATDRCRLIAEGNCLKARAEKAETELESERAALACRDPEREKKEGL